MIISHADLAEDTYDELNVLEPADPDTEYQITHSPVYGSDINGAIYHNSETEELKYLSEQSLFIDVGLILDFRF